ncbi:hypothetical protein CRUP_029840 [Coryphaenoides rupestris]|nr:hypothetical protein CRUP_029840 [Coryphaenoides rupestris]
MVPTVDTVRYHFLAGALVAGRYPVLLTGPVGTGKTLVAQGVLQSLEPSEWAVLTVNMSSQEHPQYKTDVWTLFGKVPSISRRKLSSFLRPSSSTAAPTDQMRLKRNQSSAM